MAFHFSANQYEGTFDSKRLLNWTMPRKYKERPRMLEGYTEIISNSRGHLKPGIRRSPESPWGTFMGTWDMPLKIPPPRRVFTARSARAAEQLRKLKDDSPLNGAANGYRTFPLKPIYKKIERPSAPAPPVQEKAATPAPKSPVNASPALRAKTATPKTATPKCATPSEPVTPKQAIPIASRTPRRMSSPPPPSFHSSASIPATPSPPSRHSASPEILQ